jgi:putative SOS response-associated peptidase YedK
MCIEYARTIGVSRFTRIIRETGVVPPFVWMESMPSPGAAQFHIQIGDEAVIARPGGRHLVGETMSWGWKDGRQVIFNMKSENCDFSRTLRVLILATGFYEFTEPADPRESHRDRHFFTMRDEEWFWIAGVAHHGRFAMLTTRPGPDIKPYHKRQLCLLPPAAGVDWLNLTLPQEDLLGSSPSGMLMVRTLHETAPVDHARYQFI